MLRSLFLIIAGLLPALAAAPFVRAEWQSGEGYRYQEVNPAGTGPGFTRLPPEETGLAFTNLLSLQHVARNRTTENGSGVALGDVDGDGLCDIFLAGLESECALYKNLGDWKFRNITAEAGLALPNELTTGVTFADIDGDRDLDLLANGLAIGTRAFLNDGLGKFSPMTNRLVRRFAATSLALADIDRDQDLDLYVTTYRTMTYKDELPPVRTEARLVNGKIVVSPEGRFVAIGPASTHVQITELGERDFIYANLGKGQFGSIAWTNGTFVTATGSPLSEPEQDWGLSVMLRDLNGDNLPDIYVCNDFFYSPDRIFLNEGNNRFQAVSFEAVRKVSLASMAVDVADINRDGLDDIFVVEMLAREHPFRQVHRDNLDKTKLNSLISDPSYRPEVSRNTLFLNRGDGTYAEIAEFAGVDASEWSWGAIFQDVDLDGYEDIIIPTGNHTDVQHADRLAANARDPAPDSFERRVRHLRELGSLRTPIVAFRNNRDLTFADVGGDWGFKYTAILNGMACADLDNDGDLDLVGNALNGAAPIYRNETPLPRVAIRLRGREPNTLAIGARLTLTGGPVAQSQVVISGSRYLSGDDPVRVFAAGPGQLALKVRWPDGTESSYAALKGNRIYEIFQPATGSAPASQAKPTPRFEDQSGLLDHRHQDSPFDDFTRQPLLPFQLSHLGPGLTAVDLDQDGFAELVVPSGKGGALTVFKNNRGKFVLTNWFASPTQSIDQLSAAPFSTITGGAGVLISQSNYETGSARPPSAILHTPGNAATTNLNGAPHSFGAIATADIDADGDLDVFAGARVLPGRWPQSGPSRLFRNDQGNLIEISPAPAFLSTLGMVSSATFADMDDNGSQDLIVATELGTIKLFLNEKGTFTDATNESALGDHVGFWNSVAVGDFNNDGLLDFLAGNLGDNHKYRRYLQKPLQIWHGDLTQDGKFDIIESYYNEGLKHYAPWQDLQSLLEAAPDLKQRVQSYGQFSVASLEELFPEAKTRLQSVEIATTSSALFLNKGGVFQHLPLPAEVQFAPVYGIAVADFNADGNEDAFLAQNNSHCRWDQSALDSGAGVLLFGDGQGRFRVESTVASGLAVRGDGRGALAFDYDFDGRIDLAVAQNNGPTKLFKNSQSPAGTTFRLIGSSQNPFGFGASVHLVRDGKKVLRKTIASGSGYLSHPPAQQTWVLKPTDKLAIRWPDGKTSEVTPAQIETNRSVSWENAR